MSTIAKIGMTIGITTLTVLAGWGLMRVTKPNEQELLKELPESNPAVMKAQQQRQTEILKALKRAAESEEPIWLAKPKKG
ncbi:hypothetical protein TrispH2_002465 [Trichoplax sp. H2]|nr:hypothetical protein TrispH2_002465 [Trichoplax sp. H2]|eukprot:RDD44825.1 hypothetical protein TrispH2_002465 [Trichoplax sp. H2]